MLTLTPHPRLYIGRRETARLRGDATLPILERAGSLLDADVQKFAASPVFEWSQNTHNAHLLRARLQQRRVISLLVQWLRRGDCSLRDAVVAHLREMAGWECWSWITWREGNRAPDAIWDLSYGENAATLAIAWDLLRDTLSGEDRDLILGMVRKWVVPSFMKHSEPGHEAWWFANHNCNWLAVCAGGAGLVALAMHEDLPEAGVMLERANAGVMNFMRSLEKTGGGWTEGVVYWNYGMRYAFMFLLSYEKALDCRHPAFDLPATAETLRFPLAFAPYGKACAFGDISDTAWQPVALHYAAAERVGATDVLRGLDAQPYETFEQAWATVPELLALHPGAMPARAATADAPEAKLYPGLRWGYLADRMPDPGFYVAVRGGTTADPHNSADLLSWHCLVDGQRLVSNVTNREYIDTTFSDRRFELPEIRADSKNTLLVGGVGMAHPGVAEAAVVAVAGYPGIRLDATAAYRIGSMGNPTVSFVGRLFLLLAGRCLLILDRVELKHTNRIEVRLHSYARVKPSAAGARLVGEAATATVAFAASVPCVVAHSWTTPTNPAAPQARVLRWATTGLHDAVTFATLVVPGRQRGSVTLTVGGEAQTATVTCGRRRFVIVCGLHLESGA